mgnify:CR=1 FL=1
MKKTIIILLILSICVALFACNRTENDESSDAPKKEGTSVADDSSAEESVAVDESSEIPEDPENVPASQLMSMDKNSIVAYAESLAGMVSRNTTEIPEDFFYPKTDNDFPSADDPLFAKMRSNIDYYMRAAGEYGIFRYDYLDEMESNDNQVMDELQSESEDFELMLGKYKTSLENRDYDDARGLLARVRESYRKIEDEVASQIVFSARAIAQDSTVLRSIPTYHPRKFHFAPYRNYVENVKNSALSREAIEWIYGFSSYTDRLGDGYAGAIYPYGVLSVCRYPRSHDVLDDHIMIWTYLPILDMNIQATAGETTIPIEPDATGTNPTIFRVRPNCAFDSAEILPIDEENEEVTFVLYDENGDEIKRITFNYMTYVFRETYPA